MKITIDFDKKEVTLEGNVNLQELFLKLADLNVDLSKYTLVQKQVSYTALRNTFGGSSIGSGGYGILTTTGTGVHNKAY